MNLMTLTEIGIAEAELGIPLPSLYRRLLTTMGHGRKGTIEIYNPMDVSELFEPFFDDPAQLFAPYFPYGCDNHLQELWIIDADAKRAASIWHETVPDDWPEEEWWTYDEWQGRYLTELE